MNVPVPVVCQTQRVVGDEQVDPCRDRLVDDRGGRVDGEQHRPHGLLGVTAHQAHGVPVLGQRRVVAGLQSGDHLTKRQAGKAELPDGGATVLVHRESHKIAL
jgi:hypothetical protein